MEPRLISRGNSSFPGPRGPGGVSFNGATAYQPWKLLDVGTVTAETLSNLQWSHGLSAVETGPGGLCGVPPTMPFNGATAYQPWKRLSAGGLAREQLSFNGATAYQPWKQRNPSLRKESPMPFNGATAYQPWKRPWPVAGR